MDRGMNSAIYIFVIRPYQSVTFVRFTCHDARYMLQVALKSVLHAVRRSEFSRFSYRDRSLIRRQARKPIIVSVYRRPSCISVSFGIASKWAAVLGVGLRRLRVLSFFVYIHLSRDSRSFLNKRRRGVWVTRQHFGLVSNRTNVGSCKQRFPIATYGAPTRTTAFEQVYGAVE